MPCSISRDEELAYERQYNQKKFGVAWTDARLTEAAACWLADALRQGLKYNQAPAYVKGWVEQHDKRDVERKEREQAEAKRKEDEQRAKRIANLDPKLKARLDAALNNLIKGK